MDGPLHMDSAPGFGTKIRHIYSAQKLLPYARPKLSDCAMDITLPLRSHHTTPAAHIFADKAQRHLAEGVEFTLLSHQDNAAHTGSTPEIGTAVWHLANESKGDARRPPSEATEGDGIPWLNNAGLVANLLRDENIAGPPKDRHCTAHFGMRQLCISYRPEQADNKELRRRAEAGARDIARQLEVSADLRPVFRQHGQGLVTAMLARRQDLVLDSGIRDQKAHDFDQRTISAHRLEAFTYCGLVGARLAVNPTWSMWNIFNLDGALTALCASALFTAGTRERTMGQALVHVMRLSAGLLAASIKLAATIGDAVTREEPIAGGKASTESLIYDVSLPLMLIGAGGALGAYAYSAWHNRGVIQAKRAIIEIDDEIAQRDSRLEKIHFDSHGLRFRLFAVDKDYITLGLEGAVSALGTEAHGVTNVENEADAGNDSVASHEINVDEEPTTVMEEPAPDDQASEH